MKDIKYFENKVERLEKVIKMRECQLRCACDGLEYMNRTNNMLEAQFKANESLEAVDAIYDLHNGEKIENGFLGEPHKRG